MTAPVALLVAVIAGLVLAEIKTWAPWLAKKIVDRAALRYEEPKRAIEREAGHANVETFKTPVSQLLYASYTYIKAPYRAREQPARQGQRWHVAQGSFLGSAMTAQSIALVIAMIGLGAVGEAKVAGIGGLILASFGILLDASYRMRRFRSRTTSDRKRHDLIVRKQLAAIVVVGVTLLALEGAGVFPLWASPTVDGALITSLGTGTLAVYASSLLDWFFIVPSISGLVGDAPCERADPPRWREITRIWFLHRAIAATFVASAVVSALVSVVLVSDAPAIKALCTQVGVFLVAGLGSIRMAFRCAAIPPVSIGDVVRITGREDRDAYVVDVSAFAIKYRFLDSGSSAAVQSAANDEILPVRKDPATMIRRRKVDAPCRLSGHCRAVNPYCRRNMGDPL